MLASCIALAMIVQSPTFVNQVSLAIQSDPARAETLIRDKFQAPDLAEGVSPQKDGLKVLFAIDPGLGKHEASVSGDNLAEIELDRVGNLLAAVVELRPGLGSTVNYVVDGKKRLKTYNLEVYAGNRIVESPPGGRKGELRPMGEWKSAIFPGTIRKWFVYLPPNVDASREYPVLIGTDAQWDREWQANALENGARDGLIPPTVGVFIEPGQDKPGNYSFRSREYDRLSPDYPDFLLKEILPEVQKLIKLSPDPAKRALIGVSSGGICGFTCCWEHPEAFGTVISAVGSFDDIAHGESLREGGHNYPFMIRLTEKKPIRVFLQDGVRDLDNQFGNWYLGNAQMAAALKFKGYDVQWRPGEGFHSSDHLRSIFDEALRWWLGGK
ncbi:MAG TPA: alpha/beta hydrolase-fold protein [Fimbriimonas sp.]|nr:alpha/beta hydrolase-fold protein [Fimbriimonas sp.]